VPDLDAHLVGGGASQILDLVPAGVVRHRRVSSGAGANGRRVRITRAGQHGRCSHTWRVMAGHNRIASACRRPIPVHRRLLSGRW
jgi:hypothetical protein